MSATKPDALTRAARQSWQMLGWQAGWAVALAAVFALAGGARAGWSALLGGAIGLTWTVYMAFTLQRHSKDHGVRLSALSFVAGWLLKVVLTISLLLIALRSKAVVPLALLAGLGGAMVAYWAWLTFRVNHADRADGK